MCKMIITVAATILSLIRLKKTLHCKQLTLSVFSVAIRIQYYERYVLCNMHNDKHSA